MVHPRRPYLLAKISQRFPGAAISLVQIFSDSEMTLSHWLPKFHHMVKQVFIGSFDVAFDAVTVPLARLTAWRDE